MSCVEQGLAFGVELDDDDFRMIQQWRLDAMCRVRGERRRLR